MTRLIGFGVHALQQGMLRCASVLTPQALRADWRREWQSELWHVRHASASSGSNSWRDERAASVFCLGAFQDALCLRRHAAQSTRPLARGRGSVSHSIFCLVSLLAACYALSLLLPGVHFENHPSRYRLDPALILIQDSLHGNADTATISTEQFKTWRDRGRRYFDGFAFYQVSHEEVPNPVQGFNQVRAGWAVAYSSTNLFGLLNLPVRFAGTSLFSESGGIVLSDELWKSRFHADPHIVGQRVRIGTREAPIIGVAQFGAWRLPQRVDAWFLEPDSELPSVGLGFVVAHLTALGQKEMLEERVHIVGDNSDDADEALWAVSLRERTEGPWSMYLFTVLLAFLCVPAITSVSLGDNCFASHKPTWTMKLCLLAFLCVKITLLLSIAYFLSLDLAYCNATSFSVGSEYVQLISSFLICLFGMRWVLLDQRHRCPVCLRRVMHPVQVGVSSRTFLGWNGTELFCMGGHTMLHVPALPTSWFSAQRWVYLDPSWQFLFSCTD